MTRSPDELGRDLVRTLRALRASGVGREQRTTLLRRVAALSVELREHFLDPQGNPDWAGRTHAYREYIREQYSKAGYSAEEKDNVQAAARYHVSTIVRDRLDDADLEAYGLEDRSSQEKAKRARSARAALLRTAQDSASTESDPLRLLALAFSHLRKTQHADLVQLDAHNRGLALDTLDAIGARARALARGVTRD